MTRSLVALTALSTVIVAANVQGDHEQRTSKAPDRLEGTLRVHPKYLYRYYIDGFGDGQKCALGPDNKFADIKPGTRIRVEGRLQTRHHRGSYKENLSPFPQTWYIQMDVSKVSVIEPKTPDK